MTTDKTTSPNTSSNTRTEYADVLAALRTAGFQHVDMVGGGGINVISVLLTDAVDGGGPELLIGKNADTLDLPPRQELTGWRVLFRPSSDPDDVTVYEGGPDTAPMVQRIVDFAAQDRSEPIT